MYPSVTVSPRKRLELTGLEIAINAALHCAWLPTDAVAVLSVMFIFFPVAGLAFRFVFRVRSLIVLCSDSAGRSQCGCAQQERQRRAARAFVVTHACVQSSSHGNLCQ